MFSFHVRQLEEYSSAYVGCRDFIIERCTTLDDLKDNSLIFVKKRASTDLLSKLGALRDCLIILLPSEGDTVDLYEKIKAANLVVETSTPRLEFARVFQFILDHSQKKFDEPPVIGQGVRQGQNVIIGRNTVIGDNTRIDNNVEIGDDVHIGKNCRIMSGVIINDNVILGEGTVIRENAVIGGWGFGFERDENGIPVRLPHVGGVRIGNDVEVGAFSEVVSGTFKPTIVGDHTKIDDFVHVSHNCRVGAACLITSYASFSGSVKVGDRCWFGPHAAVIQSTTIGNDCFVGMGAVVKKNLPDGLTVTGNPARTLEELALERRISRKLKKDFRDTF